jgi:ATP-dependent Lhr-like helicase
MISISHDFSKKLYELGYKSLTPIQQLAIPIILKGKNTLIIAPTGFGKTEAAIFPVFYMILRDNPNKISALYITPLRALNRDLELRLKKLGENLGIKVAVRHGDSTASERKRILIDPPDLLLTTPETLLYLLVNESMRELLTNVKWIIIDELQEMLDEKRGYELLLLIERIKRISRNKLQLIGLSATIGDIEIAKKFLGEEVEVAKVDARKDMEVYLDIPEVKKEYVDLSLKTNLNPETIARLKELERLIKENKPVLVFTNVRETTEFIANELSKLTDLKVLTHHGSLSREIRVEAEREFKEGKIDALVATSSLELGIDIGVINAVIQYMSPRQVIRLVQRIGRSGHSLFKVSKGFIIPSNDTYDILECKSIVDNLKENYLEKPLVETKPYDVIAHEIAGLVLEGVNDKQEIFKIITSSFLFRDLTEEEFDEILSILESGKIIKRSDEKVLPSFRLWKYYYTTNMIPDSIRDYLVIDHITNTKIGTLDYEFVASLDEEAVFVLGGKLWKVISIEDNRIYVEQTHYKAGILPSWFGESIPVEREVAQKVFEYLDRINKGDSLSLPKDSVEKIKQLIDEHIKRGYPLPSKNNIVVEINGDLAVVHSALGTRGNNTLGALLSLFITRIKGVKTTYRSDAYHIAISSVIPIDKTDFEKAIKMLLSLSDREFESYLSLAIKESPQFKWKLLVEVERFGLIDKEKVDIQLSQNLLKAYTDTIVGEEAVRELMAKNYDKELLKYVRNMTWKIIEVPSFSPLAKDFLEKLLVSTENEEKGVFLEIFKRKTLNNRVKLACIICGWNGTYIVSDSPNKCPKCGSVFLTIVDNEEDLNILKKFHKGQKLSKKELKRLETLKTISSLYSQFGKYVAIGYSVPGVSINGLSKALGELRNGEDKFFEALLEEERKFLKTRKYWH